MTETFPTPPPRIPLRARSCTGRAKGFPLTSKGLPPFSINSVFISSPRSSKGNPQKDSSANRITQAPNRRTKTQQNRKTAMGRICRRSHSRLTFLTPRSRVPKSLTRSWRAQNPELRTRQRGSRTARQANSSSRTLQARASRLLRRRSTPITGARPRSRAHKAARSSQPSRMNKCLISSIHRSWFSRITSYHNRPF